MGAFTTKPHKFEAVQVKAVEFKDLLEGKGGLFDEMPKWLGDALNDGRAASADDPTNDYTLVKVAGFMGTNLQAHADDWVAYDENGIYVIKAERFKEIVQ